MRIEMKCGLHTILTIYLLSHACANGRRIRHKIASAQRPVAHWVAAHQARERAWRA